MEKEKDVFLNTSSTQFLKSALNTDEVNKYNEQFLNKIIELFEGKPYNYIEMIVSNIIPTIRKKLILKTK